MRREKGASSVLVILVLLLLVFLSVLAFVAAGSNLRLAKKNAETIRAWYRMDADAERTMSKAMNAVRQAYRETETYMSGQRFLDVGQEVVPAGAATALRLKWSGLLSEPDRASFKRELFPKVYAILSERALLTMTTRGISVRSSVEWSNPEVFMAAAQTEHPGPWLDLSVSDPEAEVSGHVDVIAEVLPEVMPSASSEATGDVISRAEGESGGHLKIMQWKQVQLPFVYKNEIKLWEGNVK